MNITNQTTGLILAGGAGRRVGGRDKGLIDWRGRPLAAHVADRLRPQVGSLLISCNRNRDYYATLAETTLADSRRDFQGPLAGLEASTRHLHAEFLVIAPCDAPLIPMDMAERLLAPLNSRTDHTADVSYAYDGEREQYLCAAIRTSILSSLTAFLDAGHRAVRHWYSQQHCAVIDFSDSSGCFANVNRLCQSGSASGSKRAK